MNYNWKKYTEKSDTNYRLSLLQNQHNIIKARLPLTYVDLEVADIVEFDKLINDMKAYGEDYTESIFRNGQEIYPYFMITEINKSMSSVSIKAIQLHKLLRTFIPPPLLDDEAVPGDLNFNNIPGDVEDYELLRGYLYGGTELSEEQLLNADVNQDGLVNDLDLLAMLPEPTMLGDVNLDGFVDNADVELMMEYINNDTNIPSLTLQQIANGDMNGSGSIDTQDIILLVSLVESLNEPPALADPIGDLLINTQPSGLLSKSQIVAYKITYNISDSDIVLQILA